MNLVEDKTKLRELTKFVRGAVFFFEDMSKHTSFRVGGPAECIVIPNSIEDIYNVLKFSVSYGVPINVMGAGTNSLVSDKGIPGIVIKIVSPLAEIRFDNGNVRVSAGTKISKLLSECVNRNISGLEFLSGIPGTVGGATCMNAGNGTQAISMYFVKGYVLDINSLSISEYCHKDFSFDYRWSIIQKGGKIILDSLFSLNEGNYNDIAERIKEIQKKRLKTQPLDLPNAGCIWKNPPETYAGKLIEEAGLKGFTIGGAAISKLHANFIVNLGNARAQDIYDLMRYVEKTVYEKFNINLEREIKLVGLW
jgi:UDP-N-acetylmuramate dehydrogenase